MTPEQLDRLEQLAREATPGPWHAVVRGGVGSLLDEVTGIGSLRANDAPYIAALSPAVGSELVAAARLGAAWQEAEGALPEGWQLLFWRTMSGDELGYGVEVTETVRPEWGDGATPRVTFAHGPTPTAALLALADALRKRP